MPPVSPGGASTLPSSASTGRARSSTVALLVIVICQLMVVLDATIVNIALPDIQGALHFSSTNLSWVLNAYSLTFGGLLLLGARAGDLFGRRTVFLGGIALFTLASLAGGLTDSAGLLLAARAVQGVGAAFASPSALSLLMILFAEGKERTRALGLYTAVSVGGSAVGLIAGGILTEWASWRWVFFVNVPIGIALLFVARPVLPETERNRGRVDVLGAIFSTLGMGALVYGIVRAASDGWTDSLTVSALAAGVVMLALFAVVEARTAKPIVPLRMFADRTRNLSYLSRLLMVASMFGLFFFLTQFLQDVLHYSAVTTGLAFLPLTAALFIGSQLSVRLMSTRIDPRFFMAGGITLSALGMLWVTRMSADSSYLDVLGPLLMVGLGNGTAFVPLTSAALTGVAPADAGAASGLVNVMQQLGGSLGLAVLVTVFGTASRSAAKDVTPGIDPAVHAFVSGADRAFEVAFVLLAVTVLLALFMRSTRRNATPAERITGPDASTDEDSIQLAEAETA